MKKNMKRALAVLFTLCLLCAAFLPAFAAGTGSGSVFESEGVYLDGDENPHPFHTTVSFDAAAGRLTIDEDKDNILSIDRTEDLINWIKTVANGVKTVYITKNSRLSPFTKDEHVLAAYPFHRAFAYLENLERFEVESGNTALTVKDGVLYSSGCLSLVHYPAAKPDKTYKIEETCMQGLEPYAFFNTKYLERLEFPSARSSLTYFVIEPYSLAAADPDTGAPRESSVKQIVFYADEETFFNLNDFYEGNNVAHSAELICEKRDAGQTVSGFFTRIVSYFRMMINMMRQMFESLFQR